MEIYLVGGAVRDELLGLDVHERDWVVVGGTSEQLLREGYEQVGKDFPVFLHPTSKEEYALARIERKISSGHTGFECDSSEHVTLEEDLLRRDLTINAIAKSESKELIDPYGGVQDLKLGILRHVSSAFVEDPLRVLRVARFYARFPDFSVHPSTEALLEEMVSDNLLEELPPERIWTEVLKALHTDNPHRFFGLLASIAAHRRLWPSVSVISIQLLAEVSKTLSLPEQRFAALCFNAGDGLASNLTKLKVPNKFAELGQMAEKFLDDLMDTRQTAEGALAIMSGLDAFRRPERFQQLIEVAECIGGVLGKNEPPSWLAFYEHAKRVDARQVDPSLKGPEIGAAINKLRCESIAPLI